MSDKREYIVPATPGWSVVRLVYESEDQRFVERDVYEEPIIAWQMETEPSRVHDGHVVHMPVPITTEGGGTSEHEISAIKTPSGTYEVQGVQTCDTLQDFLRYANAHQQEKRKLRKV